jgi:hypothetical protein
MQAVIMTIYVAWPLAQLQQLTIFKNFGHSLQKHMKASGVTSNIGKPLEKWHSLQCNLKNWQALSNIHFGKGHRPLFVLWCFQPLNQWLYRVV